MIGDLERSVAQRAIPGDRAALIFDDGSGSERRLTYHDVIDGTRRVAAAVAAATPPRALVLVSCSPGPEFVQSFLGVQRAGRVPVPTYPPGSLDDARNPDHLTEVVHRSRADACLTDASFLGDDPGVDDRVDPRLPARIDVDPVARCSTPAGTHDDAHRSTPAFVMFTSGTTDRRARGVVVSRSALSANLRAIDRTFPGMAGACTVTWLPPHHDMGLVGGLLAPLSLGSTIVCMSPKVFVRRPIAWLQAISTHDAVLSAAPNFAYDLCVRRVTDEELAGLSLGSWRHAVTGSEPVRRSTMQAFTERFAEAGFGPRTFRPSYGMAEATLLISAGTWDPSQPGGVTDEVPCGAPTDGATVCIVHPETEQPVRDGADGEIWLAGPSMAERYLDDDERSRAVFGASLSDRSGSFFRTGDLGRLVDGEVVVTGRRAALIRVRGRDHSAEVAEMAAKDALASVRACVATTRDTDEGTRTCLICEVSGQPAATDIDTIRTSVATRSGLWLDDIVFVANGALPKTSSGKVRRALCLDGLDGLLAAGR